MHLQRVAFGAHEFLVDLVAFHICKLPYVLRDWPAAHDVVGGKLGLQVRQRPDAALRLGKADEKHPRMPGRYHAQVQADALGIFKVKQLSFEKGEGNAVASCGNDRIVNLRLPVGKMRPLTFKSHRAFSGAHPAVADAVEQFGIERRVSAGNGVVRAFQAVLLVIANLQAQAEPLQRGTQEAGDTLQQRIVGVRRFAHQEFRDNISGPAQADVRALRHPAGFHRAVAARIARSDDEHALTRKWRVGLVIVGVQVFTFKGAVYPWPARHRVVPVSHK